MNRLRYSVVLLLALSCAVALAQRTVGNSRSPSAGHTGSRNPDGRTAESSSATSSRQETTHESTVSTFPCPAPPVFVSVPIVISPLTPIVPERSEADEAEPDREEAILLDTIVGGNESGFDFSSGDVVRWDDKACDVYFVNAEAGPEFVVPADADIQAMGTAVAFTRLHKPPPSGWSPTHRVVAEPENTYVVWTWDNQYFAFRVTVIAEDRVAIEWREMDAGAKTASDILTRNGTQRRPLATSKFKL